MMQVMRYHIYSSKVAIKTLLYKRFIFCEYGVFTFYFIVILIFFVNYHAGAYVLIVG